VEIDTPWDIERLAAALDDPSPDIANEVASRWIERDPTHGGYRQAAALCASWRRFDLAGTIRLAAFHAGSDPYEAAYAVNDLWYCADGEGSAQLCDELAAALPQIEFAIQNDDFFRTMVLQALADLKRLALFDAGSEEVGSDPLSPIAVEAIWKRTWALHGALQFPRGRAYAALYIEHATPDPATVFQIIETFFDSYGGADAARDILLALELSGDDDLRRRALLMSMAYETGDDAAFEREMGFLLSVSLEPEASEPARLGVASAWLYAAGLAAARGETQEALGLCDAGADRFSAEEWRAVFCLARGAVLDRAGLPGAVEQYEVSLEAQVSPRSPFGFYAVADSCAAAGRWDLTHEIFERFAAGIRSHYAPLAPEQPAYDTGVLPAFPRSALFLSGWSVGDNLCRYGLLRAHFGDGDYTVMLDRRVVDMARRAQPSWNFSHYSRVHEVGWAAYWRDRRGTFDAVDHLRCPRFALDAARRHGAVILQEDMTAVHAAAHGQSQGNTTPALEPDPARVASFAEWLDAETGGRPAIAVSWRAGLQTTSRAQSALSVEEIAAIIAGAPAAWILLQYDWDPSELEAIEKAAGVRLIIVPDLDLRDDLEGVAALARACDLTMTASVSTREVCAAAGAGVFSLSIGTRHAEAWRRAEDQTDTIFATMRHADPSHGRQDVIRQACEVARDLCAVGRHRG